MASSYLEEDLSCPVCYGIYEEPLLLACSHSVCRTCLQQWRAKDSFRCPVCRQLSAAAPHRNLALKNVCEAYRAERRGRRPQAAPQAPVRPRDLCPLHQERQKLFCLEDEEPVCVVCQVSERHRSHTLRPTQEAAQTCREKIKGDLKFLEKNLKALEKAKQTCQKTEQVFKNKTEQERKPRQIGFKPFQITRGTETLHRTFPMPHQCHVRFRVRE
ncbi:hypothetical protein COCON_G00070220 [Conger conger]|uniref:Uncharacterized protein n=1 Tax=Conger conger TaxID=82655 RepID=A0A9Q1DT39_CONCO|nr:hypothetical protein COCON_G00070220 [Conger conger]